MKKTKNNRLLKMKFTDGRSIFQAIEFQQFPNAIPFVPGNKYLIKGTNEKIEVRRGIMMLSANNIQFLTGKKEEPDNQEQPKQPPIQNQHPTKQQPKHKIHGKHQNYINYYPGPNSHSYN